MKTKYKNISVSELENYFNSKKDFILLDVREKFEFNIASIINSLHIPMMEIPHRINELNQNKDIVIICKSGVRSAKVCEYLYDNGFLNLKNVSGGINAWSKEIDGTIPLY